MVGISFDNFSGNIGDRAIGLSVKKILDTIDTPYEEITNQNFQYSYKYDTIIVGGGLLLRNTNDLDYTQYRVKGKHILNCMGVLGTPNDLEYLEEYKYLSVRSLGDKQKLSTLTKNVSVVPCTTMLLEDLVDFDYKINRPSIGIHIFTELITPEQMKELIIWTKIKIMTGFDVYFIPITQYRNDHGIFAEVVNNIGKGCILMPNMNPLEVFTFIGKMDYMVTYSLHGAIFAYVHNVPFALCNVEEKMKFFMEERGLSNYMFKNITEMITLADNTAYPDFTDLIFKDKQVLREHIYNIKQVL